MFEVVSEKPEEFLESFKRRRIRLRGMKAGGSRMKVSGSGEVALVPVSLL